LQAATIQEYARLDDPPDEILLEPARAAQNKLYQAITAKELPIKTPPSSYIAILAMDGDHMGRQKFPSAKAHQDFSRALAKFAQSDVTKLVEQDAPGRVIYAGGDDVLAILPAEHALFTAEKLRLAFAEKFSSRALTVSTGIAYVHRTHPLQTAVRAAQDMQQYAKDDCGRNAMAIALLQRSGEPHIMGAKWDIDDPQNKEILSTASVIQYLVDAMSASGIARNFPYDLEQIVYTMANINVASPARHAEFKRVFKRRHQKGFEWEPLAEALIALAEYGIVVEEEKSNIDPVQQAWENLAHWTRLARFLAGEIAGEEAAKV